MNEFDQFVRYTLRERWYIRYADDFVIMSEDRVHLEHLIPRIQSFLPVASGVDFFGWVHFPDHQVLRRTTRSRLIRAVRQNRVSVETYHGLLAHGNTHKVRMMLKDYSIGE